MVGGGVAGGGCRARARVLRRGGDAGVRRGAADVSAAGLACVDAVGVVGAGGGRGAARRVGFEARSDVATAGQVADAADLVGVELGEIDVLVRAHADPRRYRARRRDRILRDHAGGRDAADAIVAELDKPDVAVGTADHRSGAAAGLDDEFGDHAGGRDAADLVAILLREPEVAVAAGGDAEKVAGRRGDGKFGERAGRGHAPDLVAGAVLFREPQIAVGAGGDGEGAAVRRGDHVLGEHPRRADAGDAIADRFGEPQVAARAAGDAGRVAAAGSAAL